MYVVFLLCMFLLYVSVLLPVGVIKDNNNGVGRVDKVQQAPEYPSKEVTTVYVVWASCARG